MDNEFKIGDKVYSNMLGPECYGIVVSVDTYKNGQQCVEIVLNEPIHKFVGLAHNFSKLE